jgi:hypothetical protein
LVKRTEELLAKIEALELAKRNVLMAQQIIDSLSAP